MGTRQPAKWPKRRLSHVLLIEDNVDHAKLLADLLNAHFAPINIHTVDTAEDGIELAHRNPYDMIFLDAFLHNRSTIDHVGALCEHAQDVPIIVLAGSGDEALAAEVIKRGATEYFVKNRETLDRLPTLLKKHMARPRQRRRAVAPAPAQLAAGNALARRLVREVEALAQRIGSGAKGKSSARPAGARRDLSTIVQQIHRLRNIATNALARKPLKR